MTKSISIAARVSPELNEDLSKVASLLARPKSWIVEQALKEYLAHEKDFIRAVMEGAEEAERGDLIPHAEVIKKMEKKLKR